MLTKVIYLIVFGCLFIIGVAFALLNSQSVTLNYYFDSIDAHLSLLLLLAVLSGAVLGVIVSLMVVLKSHREVARLRKAIQLAEREISELRKFQVKTSTNVVL
ncbi:MAG: LapA family protein [Gammaproteobacteria bacterium]|nr:LapA family protein [Gammaproteobacteria bacterium]